MIIRDALRCETCGKLHVVRIGMGQEESQQHRFPCRNCGEDIAVTLMVDYENTQSWVVVDENAVQDLEEAGAEIVNLDANFLIPSHLQGADLVSPRFEQIRDLARSIDKSAPQPHRRPDYAAEWKRLRKAWNLHRSGQKPLSRVCVKTGSAAYYSHEPLTGLPDGSGVSPARLQGSALTKHSSRLRVSWSPFSKRRNSKHCSTTITRRWLLAAG